MKFKTIVLSSVVVLAAFSVFAETAIPLPEHPRPDWERAQWLNLNGAWDFGFKTNAYDRQILVPFGWGCKLSGVKDEGDTGYYRRTVTVPAAWKGKRVFVVVGAADHDTTCTFAGNDLGKHVGGYTPFEYELTELVRWGEKQTLEFKIWDPSPAEAQSGHYLYGKQGYGNARGIWQTVYLEARGDAYLECVRFMPHVQVGTVDAVVRLGAPAARDGVCTVELDGKKHAVPVSAGAVFGFATIKLDKPRLWTLEDPQLYDVTCRYGDDVVKTYFGFREFGTGKNPNGHPYVTLNGKPVYLQLTLDQSYHPDGWYTFPSDEFMKNEILLSKKLGLSGNRVHIKVEIPRKLYWADKLGVLIQADVPCAWGDASEAMFEEHWKCFEGMVRRDFNHPCVYQWTLFNETWGLFSNRSLEMGLASGAGGRERRYRDWAQRKVAEAYHKAKFFDPTRLVEDNSACHHDHVATDVNSWHFYLPGYEWERALVGTCATNMPGSADNYVAGQFQKGEPMMNSECGNVWGYKGSTGDVDWSWDYHMMINAFRRHLQCAGWLYTEHHDVINEWNGYVRFDRTPKHDGIAEIFPGMSLKDLHADAYIALDEELCRTYEPGKPFLVPATISLVTDKYAGQELSLRWDYRWMGADGRAHEAPGGSMPLGKAKSWQNEKIADVRAMPPADDCAGALCVTLFAGGKPVARNFHCFVAYAQPDTPAVKPAKSAWETKTWDVFEGKKFCGAGKGAFEYEFALPKAGKPTFRAELSAKRLNGKDIPEKDEKKGPGLDCMLGGGSYDRSRNPNSYPMTSDDTWPSTVKVYANGVLVKTQLLADDPADHRGILSWHNQKRDWQLCEAGSYGWLVEAEIPAAALAKRADGKVAIRLEADRGLAVYGKRFGRLPIDPGVCGVE